MELRETASAAAPARLADRLAPSRDARRASSGRLCDPYTPGAHDDKGAGKTIGALCDRLDHGRTKKPPRIPGKANQDDTTRRPRRGEDQSSRILVLRQEDSILAQCQVRYRFVVRARGEFRHGHDIVSRPTQGVDDNEVAALIGKEPQSLLRRGSRLSDDDGLLVSDGISGVDERGPYVFGREARIGVQQILFSCSVGQLA